MVFDFLYIKKTSRGLKKSSISEETLNIKRANIKSLGHSFKFFNSLGAIDGEWGTLLITDIETYSRNWSQDMEKADQNI